MSENAAYAAAGVDTAAGDRAVELMKAAVAATHGPNVLGGVGGFAGLFDLSAAKTFERPLLATSTDGVGTKVAIAQAIDKHDSIGQDLVGMVVDDIIVVGAVPLFMKSPSPSRRTSSRFGSSARSSPLVTSSSSGSRWR